MLIRGSDLADATEPIEERQRGQNLHCQGLAQLLLRKGGRELAAKKRWKRRLGKQRGVRTLKGPSETSLSLLSSALDS